MSLKIRASQIRAILCAAVTLGFMGPALAQTAPAPVSPIKLTQQKRPAAQPSKILGPIAQTAASQPAASQAQPVRLASAPTTLQLKSEPSQPDWTKVCGKPTRDAPEVCYTSRDFVSDQGQPVLAFAVYDIKSAQPAKLVRFLMPLGLLVQPGIRFAVDQSPATPGRYSLCFPNGCLAEAQVSEDFVATLKKGTTLSVTAQNQAGREVTFAVPVTGLGKAFDGAAIDPKLLEAQQTKLREELQKRSDELRKRLEHQGRAIGPSAAATP